MDSNLIYVNRNESFINTASKLLEKVKLYQVPAPPQTTNYSNNNNVQQVLPSKNHIINNSKK